MTEENRSIYYKAVREGLFKDYPHEVWAMVAMGEIYTANTRDQLFALKDEGTACFYGQPNLTEAETTVDVPTMLYIDSE